MELRLFLCRLDHKVFRDDAGSLLIEHLQKRLPGGLGLLEHFILIHLPNLRRGIFLGNLRYLLHDSRDLFERVNDAQLAPERTHLLIFGDGGFAGRALRLH